MLYKKKITWTDFEKKTVIFVHGDKSGKLGI